MSPQEPLFSCAVWQYDLTRASLFSPSANREDLNMAETQKITASVAESGVLCVDSNGNRVMAGGGGPRATDLLLMAVAGCSGAVLKVVLAQEGFTPATIEDINRGRPRRPSSQVLCHQRALRRDLHRSHRGQTQGVLGKDRESLPCDPVAERRDEIHVHSEQGLAQYLPWR